jgi:glyoxylase-like metal-dependent hydrolase (beta-lactamase superfamily II)
MRKLGGYEVFPVETGRFRLDGGAMFGIVPKPLWERQIPPDERNRIPLAMRCLLLRGFGKTILVDTGIGTKGSEKFKDIYGVDHRHSELVRSLENLGVDRSEVTDVILTHLHFDHCGGSTYEENGEVVPTFPNATHYIQREHWEWALDPNPREKASFLQENFLPLKERDLLRLLEGEEEVFPNVEIKVFRGHTRAMQTVLLRGEEGTLFYGADLFPTRAHVAPAWIMAYDVEPLVTLREKEEVLALCAEEQWVVFFEHDPDVGTAQIASKDGRYEVLPVNFF